MSADPAPRPQGASPRGVTWQDLFDAADSERLRSSVSADLAIERARASDQQSERERDVLRGVARSQRRRADVFQTLAILIARVAADAAIQERLREIAQQEAADAAAREAESDEQADKVA